MNKTPPKYPLRFFRWFCHPDYVEDIEGDLLERFEKRPSRWLFTLDVLRLFRPEIIKPVSGMQKLNNYGMLKHHLKISYRNLLRRKSFTLINIGGLVMGLTITILISLWINYEFSFDRQNDHYNRIARVMLHQSVNEEVQTKGTIPFPLSIELEKQYADDFEHVVLSTWSGDFTLSSNEVEVTTRGAFMGESAPNLMSLNMLYGNRNSLSEASSALISASTAKSLFGGEDPIGKTITTHQNWSMTVTGIFEDIPSNSRFHRINFIGSWSVYEASIQWINKMSWNGASFHLFVQLREGVNMDVVSEKISPIVQDHLTPERKQYNTKIFLHPMKDWHLRSNWKNGIRTGGEIQYIWWFGIIGGFVLLLACVNYMNLSTAQSIKRAKEVGIRKSIGTNRVQLITQFLTESVFIVFIAFLIASLATFFALPYFNLLTSKDIIMPLSSPYFWAFGLGFAVLVGLLSGSYPALYLSSFNATQVLKGTYQNTLSAVLFRKFLVVFQFTIAMILIIGTLIIAQQINYAGKRLLGYNQSGIISIQMKTGDHWNKNEVIKNELLSSGLISHFTQTSASLTEVWTEYGDISWKGKDPNFQSWFCAFFVNHNYGETISWKIIDGRDFSTEMSSDSSTIIINEAAANYMQLNDPVGKIVKWNKNFKIIGVVKNLLVESPFSEVRPTVYVVNRGDMANHQLLKLNPKVPTLKAIEGIEDIYKQHVSKVPFTFEFVSDVHEEKFKSINRIGMLSTVFAVLAIFISGLGLFGLAAYIVEQRTKEIGIRKVLGASIFSLWKLLSSEFVLLVLIACFIALPFAYYFLSDWLEDYEYRIQIQEWLLVASCLGALFITLLTVSAKSVKAAFANPVESLRNE
ncbi:FtsX-like permease family protein [Ekhidna sp.]